jgi:hypothetical protein
MWSFNRRKKMKLSSIRVVAILMVSSTAFAQGKNVGSSESTTGEISAA